MSTYDEISNLQSDLIRKSQGGSLFLAPIASTVIDAEPFVYTPAAVGPPAVPASLGFKPLPEGYGDLGYLTDDGIQFENETTESNVTSWQAVEPTRAEITSDIDSLTVVAQETKLLTIGLYTGASLTPASRNASTGTVSFAKPPRPSAREYRGFAVFIDGEGEDEYIVGRIYPRLKVTNKAPQQWGKSDNAVTWGVTLSARQDSEAGYSCRYVFGGMGWRRDLAKMGFTALT